jgi:hypothetical protein
MALLPVTDATRQSYVGFKSNNNNNTACVDQGNRTTDWTGHISVTTDIQ